MRSFILTLILLPMCIMLLQAQQLNKDSLLRLLPLAKEDTLKVYLLLSISDNMKLQNQKKQNTMHDWQGI